jgi:hypothetical protein
VDREHQDRGNDHRSARCSPSAIGRGRAVLPRVRQLMSFEVWFIMSVWNTK